MFRDLLLEQLFEVVVRVTGETTPAEATRQKLAEMMVGRDVLLTPLKVKVETGEPLLEIRDLHVPGDRGKDAVQGITLDVRSGEVLGIAGISGNGQRELAEAIAGLRRPSAGSITISGSETTFCNPDRRLARRKRLLVCARSSFVERERSSRP